MGMNVDVLFLLAPLWMLFSVTITAATWKLAQTRVDSPGWLTLCSALLGFFPPLNLLILTFLAIRDARLGI